MISYEAKRCGYSRSDMLMIDNEMVDHTQHHTAPQSVHGEEEDV